MHGGGVFEVEGTARKSLWVKQSEQSRGSSRNEIRKISNIVWNLVGCCETDFYS